MDILILLGLTLAAAFAVGLIAQRLGVPRVVGFLIAGLLMGPSLLNIFPLEVNAGLGFVTEITLALIGFNLGRALDFAALQKVGWCVPVVSICEMLLVLLLVGGGAYLATGSLPLALILASLAVATAPAATVETMREAKAAGPVTTSALAITGMDGTAAIVLYSIAISVAEGLLAGSGTPSLAALVLPPLEVIGLSAACGTAAAFAIIGASRLTDEFVNLVPLVVALGFLVAGLSRVIPIQIVLTSLIAGMLVINLSRPCAESLSLTAERIGAVAFPLFFALAGARLNIGILPSIGLLGVVYVVGRSLGKWAGGYLGGTLMQEPPAYRANVGLALFAQAGVVIGLGLQAAERLTPISAAGADLGALILNTATAVVLILLVGGPLVVKVAVTRAGEAGQLA